LQSWFPLNDVDNSTLWNAIVRSIFPSPKKNYTWRERIILGSNETRYIIRLMQINYDCEVHTGCEVQVPCSEDMPFKTSCGLYFLNFSILKSMSKHCHSFSFVNFILYCILFLFYFNATNI
jgi:hypothetical protein